MKHIRKFNEEQNEQFNTTNDMKDLITHALNDAFALLERQVPQTKKITKDVSIRDVKPVDIISFMKDNNIPDDASFGGKDNGYDGWDDIVLSWEIVVPTTDKDKLSYRGKRFTSLAFKSVYDLLTSNGFKRTFFNTALLKEFDNTTVYDMYINKDFDRLVKYYSLPFIKA